MIKTILANSQKSEREELKLTLSLHNEIEVIAEAENGVQLLQLLDVMIPDVILIDLQLPAIDGCEATRIIKQTYPDIKIIILTARREESYVFKAIQNGANGYLLNSFSISSLANSILCVYRGGMPLDPDITANVVKAFNHLVKIHPACHPEDKLDKLTQRELDVVQLVAQGKNNKYISKVLFITEGTVKNYVTKILSKLQLNSRTELAIYVNEYNKGCLIEKNA